ncbi:MAG TPA: S16 family serine protease [Methanomicrobiales archaeon]|nr:S16 family serine protease [Methanomicrobiales archaeon]
MKLTRVLGILLLLSLCLNLYLAYLVFFTTQGTGTDLADLSNRLNLVTSENAKLSLELNRNNMTLAALENQIGLYRHQLQQLTGLVNASPGGPVGSAVLQGPAVLQQVQYSGNNPYGAGQVTQTGVLLNISAEVKPGEGRVLVDTMPLMGVVFQDAANTAVLVAENRTGVSLAGSDVIFSIRAPGQVPAVDGPSAGALMTLLAISAIEGKPLREDLTLTGTIDQDGNVGAIGGIPEKAQAAKDAGKSLLLLPRENAQLVQYTQQTRQYYGFNVIRQTPTTVDAKVYVESTIGIPVQYVDTIDDVVKIATATG